MLSKIFKAIDELKDLKKLSKFEKNSNNWKQTGFGLIRV